MVTLTRRGASRPNSEFRGIRNDLTFCWGRAVPASGDERTDDTGSVSVDRLTSRGKRDCSNDTGLKAITPTKNRERKET